MLVKRWFDRATLISAVAHVNEVFLKEVLEEALEFNDNESAANLRVPIWLSPDEEVRLIDTITTAPIP